MNARQTLQHKGKTYKYYDLGSGDTSIVLIHGLGNSSEMVLFVGEELAKTSRVIIPEIPGHMGMPLFGINAFDELVSYFRALCECLELDSYFVSGFSLGGLVSLKYAERYERDPALQGVVICASPVAGFSEGTLTAMKAISLIPKPLFDYLKDQERLQQWSKLIGKRMFDGEAESIEKLEKSILDRFFEWVQTVRFKFSGTIPALYIYGSDDRKVPLTDAKIISAKTGDIGEVVVIEGGGHNGTKEGHLAAATRISEFVKRKGKR